MVRRGLRKLRDDFDSTGNRGVEGRKVVYGDPVFAEIAATGFVICATGEESGDL